MPLIALDRASRDKDNVPRVSAIGTLNQSVPYRSVDESLDSSAGVQNQRRPQSQIGRSVYVLRAPIQRSDRPELVVIDEDLADVVDDFDGKVGNVLYEKAVIFVSIRILDLS
jgi:hypothetical protein